MAALAVVIFHANASAKYFGAPQWHWLGFFEHGVDFFFVLSGFVILHAHNSDIGHHERLSSYAMKRVIRLLPILWLFVIGWVSLRWIVGAGPPAAMVIGSLLPYPSMQPTIPPVVWTLRHEIVFYFLFATLIAARAIGIVVLALWLWLIMAQMIAAIGGSPVTGMSAFFLSGFSLDFWLGMMVYLANHKRPSKPSVLPLVISTVILAVIILALDFFGVNRLSLQDYVSPRAGALGIGFAGVLYGLVRLEGVSKAPRLLVGLGACSYALYLVHTPVNSIVQIAAGHIPEPLKGVGAGHILLVTAGIAIGWLLHHYGERPMMLWLRWKLGLASASLQRSSDRVSINGKPPRAPPVW